MGDEVFTAEFWDKQRQNLLRQEAMEGIEQDARISRVSRMTTQATGPLTDDERLIAIDNFKRFLAANKKDLNLGKLAKLAGLSPSTLSELFSGTYKGDVDGCIAKTEAAIDGLLRRKDAPSSPDFVRTDVAKRIFAIVKTTCKLGGMGAFYCVSGVGKTMALEACVKFDFPMAILIKATPGCASPVNFCREVLRQLRGGRGAADTVRTRADAFNAVVERLRGSARLILIDEADVLHIETLGLVRHIHDATGDDNTRCPVVFCGRPNLAEKIKRTTRDNEIGGSFRGRLCVEHNLMATGSGKPGDHWLFSVEEISQILAKFRVTFAADAARWLAALANLSALHDNAECGALRYAIRVFAMAILLHPNQRITLDMVRQANTITRDDECAMYIVNQVNDIMDKQQRKAAGG